MIQESITVAQAGGVKRWAKNVYAASFRNLNAAGHCKNNAVQNPLTGMPLMVLISPDPRCIKQ